ncbi:hypothetical protein CVIRNUC_002996 [Coccomyxa viridis]|uniref:Uncharacterized protein n=1 Tax=Coccomyxa viridis TaxID=1274662 RepID=A0AAV1HXC5_9CHLO|nr:hypothetical protein CVIRNUC_002996 [Coccomyxa viridis]
MSCHARSCSASASQLRQLPSLKPVSINVAGKPQVLRGCAAGQQTNRLWRYTAQHGRLVARAGKDEGEGDLLIEEELRSKRRKKKGKVNVIAPQVQQAYGVEPQSAQGQLETSYLLFLTLVFVFIILEGLFIALSGFLPEAADQLAQNVVYPAFSPSVGFFLLLSSIYGIWKSRQ